MQKEIKRYSCMLWLIIAIGLTFACNIINRIPDPINEAASTVKAVVTDAQAVITQIQYAATEFAESGMLETAEALTTDLFAVGGELKATAEAIATKMSVAFGDAPPDIPVVEGEKQNYFGSKYVLSYHTNLDYQTVLEFYQKEMVANGWIEKDDAFEILGSATLFYEKTDRSATVNLSTTLSNDKTIVLVSIQSR